MNKLIKSALLSTLILLFFSGTSMALSLMDLQGEEISIRSGENRYNWFSGGEFSILHGEDEYTSFCVEKNEYIEIGETYQVDSVADYAENGGVFDSDGKEDGQDHLSDESRWIYAQYMTGGFGERSNHLAKKVQNAIWFHEGEFGEFRTNHWAWDNLLGRVGINDPNSYDFTVTGWDIRVLNLVGEDGFHQSQIVGSAAPVPEPATMLLLGTGLIGMAGISRRRIRKESLK